jgi:glutathione S-transferase
MPILDEAPRAFYYAPQTRSRTILWLLEELELPYRLETVVLSEGRHRQPDYLALNPLGKVPLLVEDGTPVAETGAIIAYLTEKHGRLTPPLASPDRAAYLRWLFFAAGVIEPAMGEVFFGWDVPTGQVSWGSFERMMAALRAGLDAADPFLLGADFTGADIAVASMCRFGIAFGAMPKDGAIADYVARCTARDGFARADAIEQAQIAARS